MKRLIYITLIFALSFVSCKKDKVHEEPIPTLPSGALVTMEDIASWYVGTHGYGDGFLLDALSYNINLKADGTGEEYISGTPPQKQAITWSYKDGKILISGSISKFYYGRPIVEGDNITLELKGIEYSGFNFTMLYKKRKSAPYLE